MKINFKKTCDFLRKRRRSEGLSQAKLASISGMSGQEISNYERHLQFVPEKKLKNLYNILCKDEKHKDDFIQNAIEDFKESILRVSKNE